jgi:hypothetical protein
MIKFKKNEMFSFNGGTYVIKTLAYKLLETRAAQRTFDSASIPLNIPPKVRWY